MPTVMKSWSLILMEPSRLVLACTGFALPLPLPLPLPTVHVEPFFFDYCHRVLLQNELFVVTDTNSLDSGRYNVVQIMVGLTSCFPPSLLLLPSPLPPFLPPWCRDLLEKLTGFNLLKIFPAFYGIRRFISAFKSACHLSLS